MRRLLFLSLAALVCIACDGASPSDAGTDAPPADAPPSDSGPRLVEVLAELGATSEGIALARTPSGSSVLYVTMRDNRVVRVSPDGTVEDLVAIDDPLGVAVRTDGDLLVCGKDASGAAVIFLVTASGAVSTHVAAGPGDVPFGLTNFVAVAPDGSIVFSDSMDNRVFRADADGANVALVSDAISYPNGMAFAPDGATLYVASWDGATVHALAFDRATSSYGAPAPSIAEVPNVDGIVTTISGALVLVTSSRGILLATPGSNETEAITPARAITLPANAIFGDDAFGTSDLFVASLGERTVLRVRTSLSGVSLPVP